MRLLFSMLLTGLILTSLGCGPTIDPPPITDYNKRGVKKLDSGDYEGAKKDFSEAIRRNPNSAVLYKIFGGREAIRELENLGYQIHKTSRGYRLTKTNMETIQGSVTTSNGVVTTEREVPGDRYDVPLMKGQWATLMEKERSWSVDRNGKIWIAVLNRIVLDGKKSKKIKIRRIE